MSLYSDALSSGFDAIEAVAGETISYFRGRAYELPGIPAVRGQSDFEDVQSDETRVLVRSVDFLVRRELLVDADGEQFEPSRGDFVAADDGETFELMPGGENRSWRWSDSRKTHYRIHTVRRVAS